MIDVEFIESVLSSLQAFREHEIYISVRAELQVLAQFINAPCIHNKPSFEIFFLFFFRYFKIYICLLEAAAESIS